MQFSLNDLSYRNETDSVVISTLEDIRSGPLDPIPYPMYLFSRAVFNAKNQEWTQVHIRTSHVDPSLYDRSPFSRSRLSRAGRILVSSRRPGSEGISLHLVSADSLGDIITARVAFEPASEDDERAREDDAIIFPGNMESSSGTLIWLTDKRKGIKLYRPK